MKCWTDYQKLIHDMSLVCGYDAVRILIDIMAKSHNQKIEYILYMINEIGIEESYITLHNQMMIKNHQYANITSIQTENMRREMIRGI
ncbi:hypothetical protein HF846_05100 [Clostridium cadaveris]|uniref:hypothetical protein n=1 Tax=Clostridium cadaveris TaxID=1529 RepID=UPI001459B88E|nr:hypothetical protein [Clostridium cadaveris]NME63980.1 hypothetical protein [Clostridium cadaveris]